MKLRKLAVTAGLAAAGLAPALITTGAASASVAANGCTVTASRPEWRPLSNGSAQVRGVAQVRCAGARVVTAHVAVMEADAVGGDDTVLNPGWGQPYRLNANTTYTFRTGWANCQNTEVGNEENYTMARIIVNGVLSAWDSGRNGLQLALAC